MAPSIDFVDFFCKTHYSFLEGASSPEELFSTAAALGYSGLGIADLNGLYGVARAHIASKTHQLPLYIGAEIKWKNIPLSLFALNRNGYGNLCELLSQSQQSIPWELEAFASDLIAILPPIPTCL
ncbi:PHP domain-containing protein [bacterium]|nr:PHP domain-containing protein [bacterium]